jgi:hypothetical protein
MKDLRVAFEAELRVGASARGFRSTARNEFERPLDGDSLSHLSVPVSADRASRTLHAIPTVCVIHSDVSALVLRCAGSRGKGAVATVCRTLGLLQPSPRQTVWIIEDQESASAAARAIWALFDAVGTSFVDNYASRETAFHLLRSDLEWDESLRTNVVLALATIIDPSGEGSRLLDGATNAIRDGHIRDVPRFSAFLSCLREGMTL